MPKVAEIGAIVHHHGFISVGGATSASESFTTVTSTTLERFSHLKMINDGSNSVHFRRDFGVLEF